MFQSLEEQIHDDIIPENQLASIQSLLKELSPQANPQPESVQEKPKKPFFQKYRRSNLKKQQSDLPVRTPQVLKIEKAYNTTKTEPIYEDVEPSITLTKKRIIPISKNRRSFYPDVEVKNASYIFSPSLKQCCRQTPRIVSFSLSKYFKRYTITYNAFVIPPPLNIHTGRYINQFVSSFAYKKQLSYQEGCQESDLCENPLQYINQYLSWDCRYHDHLCGSKNDYVVIYDNEDLVGYTSEVIDQPVLYGQYCSDSLVRPATTKQPVKQVNETVLIIQSSAQKDFAVLTLNIINQLVQLESYLSIPHLKVVYFTDTPSSTMDRYQLDLIQRFGFSKESILIYPNSDITIPHHFQHLYAVCQTPFAHPYILQKAAYLMNLPYIQQSTSLHHATYIRTDSDKMLYGLMNEENILQNLKSYFEWHSIVFSVYDYSQFQQLDSIIDFWSTIKYVITTPNAGTKHLLFAPPGTVVIELLSEKEGLTSHYKRHYLNTYLICQFKDMMYHPIMCQSDDHRHLYTSFFNIKSILDSYINEI